jgi:hypothetical protein
VCLFVDGGWGARMFNQASAGIQLVETMVRGWRCAVGLLSSMFIRWRIVHPSMDMFIL